MKRPIVAIVGRPNVGKSSLVNRLVGYRASIVDDEPGVTRDRIYFDTEWLNKKFTVIDTGGIIPGEEDEILNAIYTQVEIAQNEADCILYVVDGRSGITNIDIEIANLLRKSKKKLFVVVNKIDNPSMENLVNEFYSLGLGTPYPISAMHGTGGIGDLLDVLTQDFPSSDETDQMNEAVRIAIVGRPNVGKSSMVNKILGEERVLVSEQPGTTRDTIDSIIKKEGQTFILVDTAGIRKKSKVDYGIELFSVDRALSAVRNADVTLLVIDATIGPTDQDKRIAEISNNAGNGLVLVINKWDLYKNKNERSTLEFTKNIREEMPHASFAEILFTSALTGQRLNNIFESSKKAYEENNKRISTSLVNQVVIEAFQLTPPQSIHGKKLKVFYAAQVSTAPPLFILFVNKIKLFKENYKRYLENKIREAFGFYGSPIRISARERLEKHLKGTAKKDYHEGEHHAPKDVSEIV